MLLKANIMHPPHHREGIQKNLWKVDNFRERFSGTKLGGCADNFYVLLCIFMNYLNVYHVLVLFLKINILKLYIYYDPIMFWE